MALKTILQRREKELERIEEGLKEVLYMEGYEIEDVDKDFLQYKNAILRVAAEYIRSEIDTDEICSHLIDPDRQDEE